MIEKHAADNIQIIHRKQNRNNDVKIDNMQPENSSNV